MDGLERTEESVRLEGRLRRSRRGVHLDAHLTARVMVGCARCTAPFPIDVDSEVALLYLPAGVEEPTGAEMALSPEDCALASLDSKERIDLDALAREQIYLSLPLKPVCKSECQGLCGGCGVDRNIETCACPEPDPDPRLAILAALKPRPR